jgi:tetratricopeptide (TPR) repeat protein
LGEAARWYEAAGDLETVSGAQGWFRAGQCYDRLGDREQALAAMARCLELDRSAVEPRQYLRRK